MRTRRRAAPNPGNPNRALVPRALLATAFLLPLWPHTILAQSTATLDVGGSLVRYDGFLTSSAASVTPTFEVLGRRGALTASGTYLRFESGNRSIQGNVVGSLVTRPAQGWRLETSAAAGASSYADFASFWHVAGEVRVHRDAEGHGVWMAATAGRTSFGAGMPDRPLFATTIAGWARRRDLLVFVSLGRAFVGDTQYSDIGLTAHGQRGKIGLETVVGARTWSRGAGRGIYGEASGIFGLVDRLALVISGGRYPSDPARGNIAGRYASLALRLRLQTPRRTHAPIPLRSFGADGDVASPAMMNVIPQGHGYFRLSIHAPAATLVELAGDFTEWRPYSLTRSAAGDWQVVVPMYSGVHQINVRIDGGPWFAPGGTTRLAGDYGDEIGSFVIP